MPVGIRGTATFSGSGGTTTGTVGAPSGLVPGDLIVVQAIQQGARTLTMPSGWVRAGQVQTGTESTAAIFHKAAVSGDETASITVSSDGAAKWALISYALSGVDTASPVISFGGQANASSANITAPSVAGGTGMLLMLGGIEHAGVTITAPTGMTSTGVTAITSGGSTASNRLLFAMHQQYSSTANTGTRVATSSIADTNHGFLMLTRELAGPTTAPTISSITSTMGQVDLSWSSVTNAATYDVERDGGIIATGHTTTSFTDTNITPSTDYTYRVRAVNAGGPGPWSATATITSSGEVSKSSTDAIDIIFVTESSAGLVSVSARDTISVRVVERKYLEGPVYPKLHTLVEDFNTDKVLELPVWYAENVSVNNGSLELLPSSVSNALVYSPGVDNSFYDADNSQLSMEVLPFTGSQVSDKLTVAIYLTLRSAMSLDWPGLFVTVEHMPNGIFLNIYNTVMYDLLYSAPYDPTLRTWFRFIFRDGIMVFATSHNGIHWADHVTFDYIAAGGSHHAQLELFYAEGDPALSTSRRIDNINVLPAAPAPIDLISVNSSDSLTLTVADTSMNSIKESTVDISSLDIVPLFIDETNPPAILSQLFITDVVSIGVAELSTLGTITISSSDSTAVSLTETTNTFVTISTSDNFSMSISETGGLTVLSQLSGTDTSTLGVTESSSLASITISGSDSMSLSLTESSSLALISVSSSDVGTVSLTETRNVFVTILRSDDLSVSISEAGSLAVISQIFVTDTTSVGLVETPSIGTISVSSSDSTTLSLAETRNIYVTILRSDDFSISLPEARTLGVNDFLASSDNIQILVEDGVVPDGHPVSSADSTIITVAEGSAIRVVDSFMPRTYIRVIVV